MESKGQAKMPLTQGGLYLGVCKGVSRASLGDSKHGGARHFVLLP